MTPILEIKQLSKKYTLRTTRSYLSLRDSLAGVFRSSKASQELWALKDVSFNINQGESVGIIGRNGAGKSTLLKILSKITPPTSGHIKARGRVASLLEVGTGFHPELSGRENIYLNGSILGLRKQEIDLKFDEIVDFAGTEQFLETPLKHYSSGMKLRLAFSVAAFLEPEIMVIDEVLAVGDAAFQKKCLGKMSEVTQGGRTVIFVSHNMGAIRQLCPRTIVLDNGQKQFDGNSDEAVDFYLKESKAVADSIPLSERQDRKGTQLFSFQDVTFHVNGIQQPVLHITTGQAVTITCKFKSDTSLKEKEVDVSIAFYNLTGNFLFACRSDVVGNHLIVKDQEGSFHCKFDRNPLKTGRYWYNVIAFHKGQVLDNVVQAGFIEVQTGDFYGTGKLPAPGRAGVCVDYYWD